MHVFAMNHFDKNVIEVDDIIQRNRTIELLTYGWIRHEMKTNTLFNVSNTSTISNTISNTSNNSTKYNSNIQQLILPNNSTKYTPNKITTKYNSNNKYNYLHAATKFLNAPYNSTFNISNVILPPKDIINLIILYQKNYHVYGIGEQICPLPSNSTYNSIANIGHSKMSKQHYFPLYFNRIYKNFGLLHIIDDKMQKKIELVSESNTSETIYIVPKQNRTYENNQKCNNRKNKYKNNHNRNNRKNERKRNEYNTNYINKNQKNKSNNIDDTFVINRKTTYIDKHTHTHSHTHTTTPSTIQTNTNNSNYNINNINNTRAYSSQELQMKQQTLMTSKNYFSGYWVTLIGAYCSAPKIISFPSNIKIKQIKCGSFHSIFLCEDGCVFGSGSNKRGQLALSLDIAETNQIVRIDSLMAEKITKISCGHSFTIVRNDQYELFSFGANEHSQLGIKSNNIPNNIPIKINDIYVDEYDVGFDFVLARNYHNDHEIYSWGDNRWGQCGCIYDVHRDNTNKINRNHDENTNKVDKIDMDQVENDTTMNNIMECKSKKKVDKPFKLRFNSVIKRINCGSFHSILLSTRNRLYAFGDNTWNQCLVANHINKAKNKHSIIKIIPKPILIELPLKFEIKYVICGHGVTFIVLL